MYNLKVDEKKSLKRLDRSSDPIQWNYKMSWIKHDEKSQTMKKSKSNNLLDDIKPCQTSRGKLFSINKLVKAKLAIISFIN